MVPKPYFHLFSGCPKKGRLKEEDIFVVEKKIFAFDDVQSLDQFWDKIWTCHHSSPHSPLQGEDPNVVQKKLCTAHPMI